MRPRVLVSCQVLLDDYEKGMTSARLDQIFQEVGSVTVAGTVQAHSEGI